MDRNNAISCVRKKKIFNYLIHTHILVVIIITSQRMTFLSWEFRCCCEKEKNNRSIIFDMLVLSQIYWFFFLLSFYSFPTKLFDIFIDKQSFLRIGMGSSIGRVLFFWVEDAQCEVTYTNLGWERSEGKPIIRVRTKSNLRLRESSEITSTTLKNHYY